MGTVKLDRPDEEDPLQAQDYYRFTFILGSGGIRTFQNGYEIMGGSKMRYQDNASDNMMGVTKQEESIVQRSTGRNIDGMKYNEVRGTVQDTGRKDQGKKQIRARLSLDYEGDEFAEEVQISDKWIRMS